jgi:hypothetical protein
MRKVVVLVFVMMLALAGCDTLNRWTTKEETPTPKPKYEALNQAFYGFPDVPVPKELELVANRSFVYETPNLKVGVLALSGNVDLESLENYFKINMVKNGWKFVNAFKFRGATLNFVKEEKTCNIKMSKEAFNTDVEIWVGPSDKVPAPVQKGNDHK